MADQSPGDAGDPALLDDCRRATCAFFDDRAAGAVVEPVTGGQSGSAVCRVRLANGGVWAAKSLPERLDGTQGRWVHRLMQHLRQQLPRLIPTVATTSTGQTLWQDRCGRCWEMTAWMSGEPLGHATPAQVISAIRAVAAVHARAAVWPEAGRFSGLSKAAAERSRQAQAMLVRPWSQVLRQAVRGHASLPGRIPEADDRFSEFAACFDAPRRLIEHRGGAALRRLAAWQPGPTSLQAVLRDLAPEHLLWRDDPGRGLQVSGLIDFHAARIDTPACDIARLLGGWGLGLPDAPGHAAALDAYAEAVAMASNPSPPESGLLEAVDCGPGLAELRRLVPILAASTVVLGLDNWFRWLFEEQRRFPDRASVRKRIELLAAAIEPALLALETLEANVC